MQFLNFQFLLLVMILKSARNWARKCFFHLVELPEPTDSIATLTRKKLLMSFGMPLVVAMVSIAPLVMPRLTALTWILRTSKTPSNTLLS